MITKIDTYRFFDILKIWKLIFHEYVYSPGLQTNEEGYDFRHHIQQNKD
jgi:hypothetical protein